MTQFNTMDNETTSRNAQPAASAGRHAADEPSSRKLLTRRQLLYGALGAGAVVAVGAGAGALALGGSKTETSGGDVEHLMVPADAVTPLADLEVIDNAEDKVRLVSDHELPYGTLIWMNDDSVAACLFPTDSGTPLAQIGLLYLQSGSSSTVLEKAVGSDEHFEIYDVRATSDGLIWTEAHVLKGAWRIYTARIANGSLGEPALLDEGNETYDTPTIAATGSHVFWQVLPKLPNDDKLPCKLMRATVGNADASCVYESARRMGTPVYAGTDSVTIAPRLDSPTVYYQLTNIDAASGNVVDQITLPSSMTPLEAGYGRTGFMFSFPDIYNNDSGIANLGTYTPMEKPSTSEGYSSAKWFGFARTPTAAPAWCNDLLIVKSSYSVCGVDLSEGTYFAIDVDDGADTYGDYLASSGAHDTFVTYANIDHTPVEGKSTHACIAKIWTTLA